ncbi:MAG: hypothetical protein J6K48_05675 [Lachnospiraceae bacterium]|nr:hypothetical protein [Lachnospiraceae bacterium]
MNEKKLTVKAAICDTRGVSKEVLEQYDAISIKAAVVIVSPGSKKLLAAYPVVMKGSEMIELEEDVEMVVWNGSYKLDGDTSFQKKTFLVVNGELELAAGAEKALDHITAILANGEVVYSAALNNLPPMHVNGMKECYPADAVKLKNELVLDKGFILRCRHSKYYVKDSVVVADENLAIDSLLEKKVGFITGRAVLAEGIFEKAALLFGEDVELEMIPEGYFYAKESVMTEGLLRRAGNKLYIDGDFVLENEAGIENEDFALIVNGTLRMPENMAGIVSKGQVKYKNLQLVKGLVIENRETVAVDMAMLRENEGGITLLHCAAVTLQQDIPAAVLKEKLQIAECGCVICSQEQKPAAESIADMAECIATKEEMQDYGGSVPGTEKEGKTVKCMIYRM